MDHLLSSVCSLAKISFHEKMAFVSDRLRAVQQDIVVQQASGRSAMNILEKTVTFYSVSWFRLSQVRCRWCLCPGCGCAHSALRHQEPCEGLSLVLAFSQLSGALLTLIEMYEGLRRRFDQATVGSRTLTRAEPTMWALFLLCHLDQPSFACVAATRLLFVVSPADTLWFVALPFQAVTGEGSSWCAGK